MSVHAASAAGEIELAPFKIEAGIAAMRFKYDEYNGAGAVLDTEQGVIPGLSAKFGQRLSAWEWEWVGSYHHGRVDYNGQTNLGAAYATRTDEAIADFALRVGRWFGTGHPWMPYAGLGYRRWDRNILPGTVGGLFESYRWKYVWAGAKFIALQKDKFRLVLDGGILVPIDPEMHVDFKGTYNIAPVLYPESRTGLRMMLTSSHALSVNTEVTLEPYYEYWELGRSPIVNEGGISVYEPASKTGNLGLNVRLVRIF
ncbi:MAG: hypothetical protein HY938_11235 [Nitrosomonadales bacterium]|nr:hypothetical protein [Nitrosomonadales bacterium]